MTRYLIHDPEVVGIIRSKHGGKFIKHYVKLVNNDPVEFYVCVSKEELHTVDNGVIVNAWSKVNVLLKTAYAEVRNKKGYLRISYNNLVLDLI